MNLIKPIRLSIILPKLIQWIRVIVRILQDRSNDLDQVSIDVFGAFRNGLRQN